MQVPVLILVVLEVLGDASAGPASKPKASPRPRLGGQNIDVEDALPGERPFQVSIQYLGSGSPYHLCGGTIYSADTIITSATCVYGEPPHMLQIVAGDYNLNIQEGNEQIIQVSQITPHPEYSVFTHLSNNIALLKLSTPLSFNLYVRPIYLPPYDFTVTGECITSGWGSSQINDDNMSDTLQKVTIPILEDEDCNAILAGLGHPHLEDVVCAGYQESGKNACIGDDGGPLTCLHNGLRYLTGVLSFDMGCTYDEYPGVYVATGQYIQWIEDNY